MQALCLHRRTLTTSNMFVFPALAFAAFAVVVKALPTASPTFIVSSLTVRSGAITPAQCTADLLCCQQTFSVLPSSILSLLPTSTPIPILGSMSAFECSAATASNIVGSTCINSQGTIPLCCSTLLGIDLLAFDCEPVAAPILPPLPTISIPGLPSVISIPGLPPITLPLGLTVPTSFPNSIPPSLPIALPTSLPISVPTSLPIPTSLPTSLPISLPILVGRGEGAVA
ncbi:hypothetical protein C8Q80DRAFT_190081 [Daedaleopsis nitida]|nr:hypothetical protein C8Q80DRAFT_190081 [Daedaleopsis nitida]